MRSPAGHRLASRAHLSRPVQGFTGPGPFEGFGASLMSSAMKHSELETYRQMLESMWARLRGDLSQMTDEALSRNGPESTGNLSNLPLHMADLGTDNFDQEFTLGLIENEQSTLDQIVEALSRIKSGTFGKCTTCGDAIPRTRLEALPYTSRCIECARKSEST